MNTESAAASEVTPEIFKFFRDFALKWTGISLGEDKLYLVESRLAQIVKETDCESVIDLYRKLQVAPSAELKQAVIDRFTTNETLFFRDASPFEFLSSKLFPELRLQNKETKTLRIWSAASSSGQEVYSIMMTLAEHAPDLLTWNFEVLATDISDSILKKAQDGIYSQLEVSRGLPLNLLTRYFKQGPDGWQVDEKLRERVTFKKFNLNEPFTGMGPFDIIFCRYVLIYFDVETKREIFEKFYKILKPNGTLFLGASEGTFGVTDIFDRKTDEKCVFYRKGE
jgi:chemotaxis protein methyltransferase CheR